MEQKSHLNEVALEHYKKLIDNQANLRHIQGRQFHPEAVPYFHHNDALFLFAVRAHFDEVERCTTQGPMNQALRRIIHMGIYDWDPKEKNQVASKSFFPVRYAAVLGNELFNIVEHNGNQVSLTSSRLLGNRNS